MSMINMSTIGITGSAGSYSLGPMSIDTISLGGNDPMPNYTIGVTKATGGYIIAIKTENHHRPSYYVIPDNKKNFDRELGKLISFHLLKSTE